jgi:predicted  nucleic acid-binding Zn-ribbon protein
MFNLDPLAVILIVESIVLFIVSLALSKARGKINDAENESISYLHEMEELRVELLQSQNNALTVEKQYKEASQIWLDSASKSRQQIKDAEDYKQKEIDSRLKAEQRVTTLENEKSELKSYIDAKELDIAHLQGRIKELEETDVIDKQELIPEKEISDIIDDILKPDVVRPESIKETKKSARSGRTRNRKH